MEDKTNELYNSDVIAYPTWKRHRSSLNTLKNYYRGDTLPINKINLDFIERFDAWGRKKLNTIQPVFYHS